jgi:hypothetical protein
VIFHTNRAESEMRKFCHEHQDNEEIVTHFELILNAMLEIDHEYKTLPNPQVEYLQHRLFTTEEYHDIQFGIEFYKAKKLIRELEKI